MNRNVLKMHSPLTHRWMTLTVSVAIIASTACSSSASSPTGVACTTNIVPGLSITVANASTGAQIIDSAAVSITDGGYTESYTLGGQPGGVISAANERPGTYNISVRKPQFAPYDTAGVTVTKDACHVQTVQVVAKLQPLASS
ncbi:MAG: hypothetical protein ABI035_10240 [Gemmatimonadaceae bacterium]